MKQWFGLALMMALPAVAAAPADIAGVWAVSGEVQGVTVSETCTLTQAPEGKLAGSCDTSAGGKFETTGTVTDKTVIFQHGGDYQGTKLTMTYTGKLGTDGAMTGTVDVDPFSVTGSFSAKKSDAK